MTHVNQLHDYTPEQEAGFITYGAWSAAAAVQDMFIKNPHAIARDAETIKEAIRLLREVEVAMQNYEAANAYA